jgi:Fumarylacetoacetase N-terminal domain 2
MKLASLRSSSPDGELAVVSRDLRHMCRAGAIARTLQAALDDWSRTSLLLEEPARGGQRAEGRTLRRDSGGVSSAARLPVARGSCLWEAGALVVAPPSGVAICVHLKVFSENRFGRVYAKPETSVPHQRFGGSGR